MRALLAALIIAPLASCSMSQEELDLIADYRQRAAQYYDINDLNRAEQQARLGLQIDPENGELRHLLGRTLLKRGDPRSVQLAGLELQQAYEVEEDFKTAYSLGEYHLRHAELLLGSALILEQKREQIDVAEVDTRATMLTDIEERRAKAAVHLSDALSFVDDAIASREEWVEALQHRASILAHQGRDVESLETIEELCAVLKRSRQAKNNRLGTQQMELAEEDFWRNSLMLDLAWEVEARGLAAGILMNRKEWESAEEQLTEILKLAPQRVSEYYNRGLARFYQGRLPAAADDMRNFLGRTDLAPDSDQVKRAFQVLEDFESGSTPASR